MSGWLRARAGTASKSAADDFRALLRRFGQRLLAYGITAVTDAGPENGAARWQAWADAINAGAFPLRVTMMAGAGRLAEMRAAGLAYGDTACGGMLRLGHAKIMLTASAGVLHPHPAALAELVGTAHRAGYPVAIHAVERDAIVAAALALLDAPPLAGAAAGPVAGLRTPATAGRAIALNIAPNARPMWPNWCGSRARGPSSTPAFCITTGNAIGPPCRRNCGPTCTRPARWRQWASRCPSVPTPP